MNEQEINQTPTATVDIDLNTIRVIKKIEEAFEDPSFDKTGLTYLDVVEGFATMLVGTTTMFLTNNNYQVSEEDKQMIETRSLEIMDTLKQHGLNTNIAYTTFILAGVLAAMSLGIKRHVSFIQQQASSQMQTITEATSDNAGVTPTED